MANVPPPPPQHAQEIRNSVSIKVAIVGDEHIGKTSLMVKYVNNTYDPLYKKTLGLNFMDKNIELGTTDIKFSLYDLGGSREFANMLTVATGDAVSILFVFDLTNKQSLENLKEWYKQSRRVNQTAIPVLVGTKYDLFLEKPKQYQEDVHNLSLKFAKAMKSSLVFTSTSDSINVQKVFKILMSKAFDLQMNIPEISNIGEPLLIYQVS